MLRELPLTVGGRELLLRLDLRAMVEAEKACPTLKLLSVDGWSRVSEDVTALLAVVYGCTWRDREASITAPLDTAYLEWLAGELGPADLAALQRQLVLLYLCSIAPPAEAAAEADPTEPATSRRPSSPGGSSGASPASASGSAKPRSGNRRSKTSTTSPDATATSRTEPTSAPASSPRTSPSSSPEERSTR